MLRPVNHTPSVINRTLPSVFKPRPIQSKQSTNVSWYCPRRVVVRTRLEVHANLQTSAGGDTDKIGSGQRTVRVLYYRKDQNYKVQRCWY